MTAAIFSALAALLLGYGLYQEWRAPRQRIATVLDKTTALRDGRAMLLEEGGWLGGARWLAARVKPFLPSSQQDQLRQQLLWAGQPFGLTADEFIFVKFAIAMGGGLVAWLPSLAGKSSSPGLLLLGAAIGYIIPERLLTFRIEGRTQQIQIDLPNFVHLLATAMESGLPLVEATRRVAVEAPGLLSAEMLRSVQEMAAGKPAALAWQHLSDRTSCQELKEILTAIIQSQEYGVGVAEQLRFQMRSIRAKKQENAREKAQAASVKMKIPTMIFILAPTAIVLLGPLFLEVLRAMGGG